MPVEGHHSFDRGHCRGLRRVDKTRSRTRGRTRAISPKLGRGGHRHLPRPSPILSGSLTVDLLRPRLGGLPFPLDPARPENLRYLAHEFDGEQTIRQARARDLHMIRELEALLERAGADAAVQELSLRTGRLGPTTLT